MEYAAYTCQGDGIVLYRMYGVGSVVEIPRQIDHFQVKILADHIFAGEISAMCPPEKMSLARLEADEWVRVEKTEYPCSIREMEKDALCKDRVELIRIPEGVRQIGNYAFYGLYFLREVSFPSSMERIGFGMFNGCQRVSRLVFHLDSTADGTPFRPSDRVSTMPVNRVPAGIADEASVGIEDEISAGMSRTDMPAAPLSEKELTPRIMKEVLDALSNEVEAVVMQGEKELYRLRFPEYYEEGKENTPARIIEIIYHGTGHQYRNCFLSRVMQFDRYDDVFPLAAAQEDPKTDIPLVLNRLRSGPEPKEEAIRRYLDYLRGVNEEMMEIILEDREFEPARTLTILDTKEFFTSSNIDTSIQKASECGASGAVSCLMEIRSRRFAGQKRNRYEL